MISITPTTLQDNKVIIRDYKQRSDLKNAFARVSKSKLLDGTVSVIHSGFVQGDRNFLITCSLSEALSNTLWELFTTETFVNVAIDEGVFNGVIENLKIAGINVTFRIELQSKLS